MFSQLFAGVGYKDLEQNLLRIWCIKNNFDEAFQALLLEKEIKSLTQITQLNRYQFKLFLKKLDLDNQSFENPKDEDTFIKLIDRESGGYGYGGYGGHRLRSSISIDSSDEDDCDNMLFSNNWNNNNNNYSMLESKMDSMAITSLAVNSAPPVPMMQQQAMAAPKMMSRKMEAESFGGGGMFKSKKMARMSAMNDPDEDTIGFKVGGAYDVTAFRDKLQHKKMPSKTDLSVAGMYNDYYFDTKRRAKGQEIKEDPDIDPSQPLEEVPKQTEGGDDTENKDNGDDPAGPRHGVEKDAETPTESKENEDNGDGKDLFYPSYCYAKSRVPYAILAARSVVVGIPESESEEEEELKVSSSLPKGKGKNKGKGKGKKGILKENIMDSCSEKDIAIWNGYLDKFGYEPKGSPQLHKFAQSDTKYKRIAFKDCRVIYNRYRGAGKIVVKDKDDKKKKKKEDKDKAKENEGMSL